MLHCSFPWTCFHPAITQQVQQINAWSRASWWRWTTGVKSQKNRPWAIQPSTPLSTAFKDEFKSLIASGPSYRTSRASRASVGICSNNTEIINSALCRIIATHSVKGQDMIPHIFRYPTLNPETVSRKLLFHPIYHQPTAINLLWCLQLCWEAKILWGVGVEVGLNLFKVSSFCLQIKSPLLKVSLFAAYSFSFREKYQCQVVIYPWTAWNLF